MIDYLKIHDYVSAEISKEKETGVSEMELYKKTVGYLISALWKEYGRKPTIDELAIGLTRICEDAKRQYDKIHKRRYV